MAEWQVLHNYKALLPASVSDIPAQGPPLAVLMNQ